MVAVSSYTSGMVTVFLCCKTTFHEEQEETRCLKHNDDKIYSMEAMMRLAYMIVAAAEPGFWTNRDLTDPCGWDTAYCSRMHDVAVHYDFAAIFQSPIGPIKR